MGTQSSSNLRRAMRVLSFGCFASYMTLLVIAMSLIHPSEANSPTRELSAVQECDLSAAFNALMRVKSTSALGELTIFLQHHGFAAQLKQKAMGKAILAPHNSHMLNYVFPKQLNKTSQGFKSTDWKLNDKQKIKVAKLLETLVVDIDEFKRAVKPDHPCDLVAVTLDSRLGLKGVVADIPSVDEIYHDKTPSSNPCSGFHRPGKGLGRKNNHLPNGKPFKHACQYKAFGKLNKRDLLQNSCTSPPTNQEFIPVGAGYDSIKGYPATTSSGGTDPGLWRSGVFDITTGNNIYCYTESSSCSTVTTVSGSSSAEETQYSASQSLGVSASYEGDSFEGNEEYSTTTNTMSASKGFTVISGSQFQKGTFTLNPTASGAKLTSSFLNTLSIIGNALSSGNTADLNNALYSLYYSYGSMYVTKMTIGGIAQMVMQMSASSSASFNSQSISVSAQATAVYGLSSGSVSASVAGSDATAVQSACLSGTLNTQQAPATAPPPFVSGTSKIDCSAWANNVQNGGSYAYPTFKVQSYSDLINLYWPYHLFDSLGWSQSFASQVASAIEDYMAGCEMGGCTATSTSCPAGYYGESSTSGCKSCYGNTAAGTYNPGDCPYGVPCDGVTGACLYQAGLYGNVWQNFFGSSTSSSGCPSGINPFVIAPYISGTNTYLGLSGTYNTTTGGQELGTGTASNLNWFNGWGNQVGGTWSLTGYYIPQQSGSYQFRIYADDCIWMWIDAGSFSGAKGGTIGTANTAYFKCANSGSSTCTGVSLSLTAFQPYPIRIQFGNRVLSNPGGIWLSVNEGGKGWVNIGANANGYGGYLFYNQNAVTCGSDGVLRPQGNTNNILYNCGSQASGLSTNNCLSKYSSKCSYVGY